MIPWLVNVPLSVRLWLLQTTKAGCLSLSSFSVCGSCYTHCHGNETILTANPHNTSLAGHIPQQRSSDTYDTVECKLSCKHSQLANQGTEFRANQGTEFLANQRTEFLTQSGSRISQLVSKIMSQFENRTMSQSVNRIFEPIREQNF